MPCQNRKTTAKHPLQQAVITTDTYPLPTKSFTFDIMHNIIPCSMQAQAHLSAPLFCFGRARLSPKKT